MLICPLFRVINEIAIYNDMNVISCSHVAAVTVTHWVEFNSIFHLNKEFS